MGFAAEQLARVSVEWQDMLDHPFLLRTRDGTIPFDTFATWMRQDYLFVEASIPFISILLAKAPEKHWAAHSGEIGMLHKELELFRERAAATGVELSNLAPSFVTHAYIQFLLATAYRESYACGYTVFYTAEMAYHHSWRVVLNGIDHASPWFPFVENWAGRRIRRVSRLPREGAGRARCARGSRGARAHGGAVRAHVALRGRVLEHGLDRGGMATREPVPAGIVKRSVTVDPLRPRRPGDRRCGAVGAARRAPLRRGSRRAARSHR